MSAETGSAEEEPRSGKQVTEPSRPSLPPGGSAPSSAVGSGYAAGDGSETGADPERPEQTSQAREGGDTQNANAEDTNSEHGNPVDEDMHALLGNYSPSGASVFVTYATDSAVNFGVLGGDQQVTNSAGTTGSARAGRVPSQEGPIFAEEIMAAQFGFAEPDWFPEALKCLDSRLLILVGEPGDGRRTAALNLLHRHSDSFAVRAVDGTMSLEEWRPEAGGVRGYLVDGLAQPEQVLKGWKVNKLAERLRQADARMVIVIAGAARLAAELRRNAQLPLVTCEPPPTRAVFEARFKARVPEAHERDRLLAALGPGALDDLLKQQLAPAHVAELVEEVIAERTDGTLRDRVSFLTQQEVPDLIAKLRDKPFRLAFLLAASVFEGLDHRVVRKEAERLLHLADFRLHAELPGTHAAEQMRANPDFVFGDSLEDLLRDIRAEPGAREVRSASPFSYFVEPVRFVRHGQAEAVLRYVWREYGRTAALMTDWLEKVGSDKELIQPVGNVMGMAARWGGGRGALDHIWSLGASDHLTSRQIAAAAIGIAAQEPVLAGEIRHRLTRWSWAGRYQLRSTVAYTCATSYGLSRPDHALQLLGHVMNVRDEEPARPVTRAVMVALTSQFSLGNQAAVVAKLAEWAEEDGRRASVALETFTRLLHHVPWLSEQLTSGSEAGEQIVALVHRALNEDNHFIPTRNALLSWCRAASWRDEWRLALEALLSALAGGMQHGVLRLFHAIDRDSDPGLAGKTVARHALQAWRDGIPITHNHPRQPGSTER